VFVVYGHGTTARTDAMSFKGRPNTPGALGEIFEVTRRAKAAADQGDETSGCRLAATAVVLCRVFGVRLLCDEEEVDPEWVALLEARDSPELPRTSDRVAEVVELALTSDRLRARYLVGRDAQVMGVVTRVFPDR
jgi:hypothetical protein